jgi:hypothetical protein
VVYASCAELTIIVTTEGCSGEPQWLKIRRQALSGYVEGYKAPLEIPGVNSRLNRLPASEVYAPIGETFQGSLLVDPRADLAGEAEGYLVNLADGHQSLKRFESAIASAAPTAYYGNDYSNLIAQANTYLNYLQFLQFGVGAGLLGTVIALLAASLRSVGERRRASRVLGTIGASRMNQGKAHALSQSVPILLCTMSAALISAIFWACLGAIDATSKVSPGSFVGLFSAPFVLALLLPLTTLPAALTDSRGADRQDAGLWS